MSKSSSFNSKRKISKKKDLHDGQSVWTKSPRRHVRTRTTAPAAATDIIIIGAGISGALSALELAAAGYDVVILDRRAPVTGSTLASTAMIQFELDTPLTELAEKIGPKKAARAYKRSFRAVSDLSQLIDMQDIDASWKNRQALYLAGNDTGSRGLEAETRARQAIGLPSRYLTKSDLHCEFGFDRTGAILSDGSAELDPAKTAASCLRAAQRLGASIISPWNVTKVSASKGHLTVTADDGQILTANKVLFCTGYEVVGDIPRDGFDIISSWAIATQPLSASEFWPGRCLIWEASDPYLYLRSTADNRILAGGEDSKLTSPERREAAIPAKSEALLRKLQKLLSNSSLKVDYAWAGAFADSPTGLPIIKELPNLPGAMAILGCGGNGITFSTIAAQIARQWARGEKDPDLDLFSGK